MSIIYRDEQIRRILNVLLKRLSKKLSKKLWNMSDNNENNPFICDVGDTKTYYIDTQLYYNNVYYNFDLTKVNQENINIITTVLQRNSLHLILPFNKLNSTNIKTITIINDEQTKDTIIPIINDGTNKHIILVYLDGENIKSKFYKWILKN